VDPNYLETYVQMNKDGKFEMDNMLDDMGCTPPCASHSVFGMEVMNTTSCEKCLVLEHISETQIKYSDNYYVDEIFATKAKMSSAFSSPSIE